MDDSLLKKLDDLCGMAKFILETSFERNDYQLTEKDKKLIQSFKDLCFLSGIDNIEKLPQFQEALKIIIKIQNFSIKASAADDKYMQEMFPREYVSDKIQKHIEKTYFPKEELSKSDISNLDSIMCHLMNTSLFITPEIEKIISFMENKGIRLENTKFMEIFMRRFTEGRFLISHEYRQKGFDLALKYVDLLTKQEDFELFNNQSVSDIMQITKRIPKELGQVFLETIRNNRGINEADITDAESRIKEFIANNQNNTITDKEKFDSFIKDVELVKLFKNEPIDFDVIKLVLSQLLKKDSIVASNKTDYIGLIQRVFESLSEIDLKEHDIIGLTLFRDDCGQKIVAGTMSPLLFINVLNSRSLDELTDEKVIDMLKYIYHENTHEIQLYELNYEPEKIDSNPLRVLQLKEEVIKKYNPNFYIINYDLMFQEIEANERSLSKTLETVEKLGIEELKGNIEEFHKQIESKKAEYVSAKVKKKSINTDETINVEDYFEELVIIHPEIKRGYPILFNNQKQGEDETIIE